MIRYILSLLLVFLSLSGCGEKGNPRYTLSEAEQKFLDMCHKDKLPVQLFEVDKTIWIYLPMEEDLVDYRGTHRDERDKSKKQFIVNTFEGNRKDKDYRFMFDITDGIKTQKDPGYKSDATEAFIKNRLTIYGALSECFFDLNALPGDREFLGGARDDVRQKMLEDHVKKGKVPDFFVIVIANIKKGIAYKTVLNLQDYIQYRSEALPFDEYNMREINELYGDELLVGDKTGKSLALNNIEWPWFLIEQIKNRINFKFLRSDFPPDGDLVIEIAGTIANTFRYYDYKDFSMVVLKDLRDKKSYQFDAQQLDSFHEAVPGFRDRAKSLKLPGGRPNLPDPEEPTVEPADSSSTETK